MTKLIFHGTSSTDPIVLPETVTSIGYSAIRGSQASGIVSGGTASETVPDGISVVARFIEALPDTYTFFDDWVQTEFRLIRMETVSIITGTEMADEFYFIVPVAFMTDFSVYDSFVISHMGQFEYEFSVLYNVTKHCAESMNTVIFGASVDGYGSLGTRFMAFDQNDMLDLRLWSSTEAWHSVTKSWIEHGYYDSYFTKENAEIEVKNWGIGTVDRYVHTLEHLNYPTNGILEELKALLETEPTDARRLISEIVPTYKQALGAMHRGTTRYLKCPKCNKRSWCKKVIKK